MHRVELKASIVLQTTLRSLMFLMHRVELKDQLISQYMIYRILFVPNAPCGVERIDPNPIHLLWLYRS